jgi:2-keto-4-pentenoate hydratase/2-oxohepta-3-ene-1,7-dioic acid hydratase in catechol pathway
VVIGKPGYQIKAEQAMEHVFGYTIMNDVSARDVQRATTQWSLGKSFPTFAPMGPWVVSKDEVADPHTLNISLEIGGEKLQNSNTRLLIFKIPALIEYISGITPLQVGDVISTGTPAGVGMGRSPQRWLKSGEETVIEIQGIGELRNPLVAEK